MNETALDGIRVRPAHSVEGDANVIGQVSVRRQPGALRQTAVGNALTDGI